MSTLDITFHNGDYDPETYRWSAYNLETIIDDPLPFPWTERTSLVNATATADTWTLQGGTGGQDRVLGKFYKKPTQSKFESILLVQIGERIKSPYVVKLKGWIMSTRQRWRGIVFEHCNYNLYDWHNEKFLMEMKPMPEYGVWNLLFQTTKALSLLHSGPRPRSLDAPDWVPIIHGDLSGFNILVQDPHDGSLPRFKLANFEYQDKFYIIDGADLIEQDIQRLYGKINEFVKCDERPEYSPELINIFNLVSKPALRRSQYRGPPSASKLATYMEQVVWRRLHLPVQLSDEDRNTLEALAKIMGIAEDGSLVSTN
jgi:serine/threonine protein kinase